MDDKRARRKKNVKLITEHQQVTCAGTVIKTGRKFKFLCDRGMIGILKDLNAHGVRTTYSCQNNKYGYFGPYLIFKNKGAKNALLAFEIIKSHWSRYWIRTRVNNYTGDIVVQAFRTHKDTVRALNTCIRFD